MRYKARACVISVRMRIKRAQRYKARMRYKGRMRYKARAGVISARMRYKARACVIKCACVISVRGH
jgi:hypothetical protein